MKKAIVLGASGGMGYSVVNELSLRGVEVIAYSRNEEKLKRLFAKKHNVSVVPGDVLDKEALMDASKGVDVIVHAVSISYELWKDNLLDMMKNVLETAKEQKAKLIVVDNIYAYGHQGGKLVSEGIAKNPQTRKGKLRLELEHCVKASGVPFIIAHFPDFYGPNAYNTLINHTLESVRKNEKASYVGSLQIPREFIFTPDGAKALVELALIEKAYDQNWNIPGERLVSGEEVIRIVRELTGYKKKVIPVSKSMIRFVGLFKPFMREFLELSYLYEHPFQLDGSKYEKEIGPIPKTSYYEGLRQTLAFQS